MSTFNAGKLELTSSQKQPTTPKNFITQSKIFKLLEVGIIKKISEYALLPAAALSSGSIYLVENENKIYWSNGTTWNALYRFERALWSWGDNTSGQLGTLDTTCRSLPITVASSDARWCNITSNKTNTTGIKINNSLWNWGDNTHGQLGDGTVITRSSPVTTSVGGNDWCDISTGLTHTLAIKTDGTLWSWGDNSIGQLGDGTTINRSSPITTIVGGQTWKNVVAGNCYSLAIKTDGSLWSWGLNTSGQLGDNTTTNRSSPGTVLSNYDCWRQISAGNTHVLGLDNYGILCSWGDNTAGQLGDNTVINRSSPVTVITNCEWCYIASGLNHSLGVKRDGTLWTWGSNNKGQLGDNSIINRSSPVTTIAGGTDWNLVSGGCNYSMSIKNNNELWAWGDNTYGQLGQGNTISRSSPVKTIFDTDEWCAVSTGASTTHTVAIQAKQ